MLPFGGAPVALLAGIIYSVILLVAAIGDYRTRRIPNRLVLLLAILGVAYSLVRAPLLSGFAQAIGGIGTGLLCWLPFYVLGWLGAGDVKLFAAAGAWLGPGRAVEGALVAALVGAVLSLIWMVRTRGVKGAVETLGLAAGSPGVLSPVGDASRHATLPYGVAIAFGAIWAGWMPRLLHI
ncbi:MAG: prepilin peptidase [Gemmatimonadaceae bacterium]